jgi:hypothetical protein
MPARTCGGRNSSLRYQFLMDSLAAGNSRTGNHQMPSQIRHQKDFEMLNQGSSSSVGGKNPRHARIDGNGVDMPRIFNPGFVTFVGT